MHGAYSLSPARAALGGTATVLRRADGRNAPQPMSLPRRSWWIRRHPGNGQDWASAPAAATIGAALLEPVPAHRRAETAAAPAPCTIPHSESQPSTETNNPGFPMGCRSPRWMESAVQAQSAAPALQFHEFAVLPALSGLLRAGTPRPRV